MRAIIAPTEDPKTVYQTCINSITDDNLRSRLNALTDAIATAAADYQNRATAAQLYTIPPNDCSNDELALGTATKKELNNVYSIHMVGSAKPARAIYDSLILRAPLGRCPLCGIGHASTLDHYLPKTKYPQLSVVPLNLVPSCKDCNTGKGTAIATTAEAQSLHPYFDHQEFTNEQWLFAEAIPTIPEVIRYFVRAPEHWSNISKERIKSHFNDFKLAKRFSIEAANELANKKHFLDGFEQKYGAAALIDLLSDEEESSHKAHVNSWQTAFYQALIKKYSEATNTIEKLTEPCPICEGEGVFVNYPCPCCEGNRYISKTKKSKIDITKYEHLKCTECDGRQKCHLCYGRGFIRREKALQLTRNRP